MIKFKKSLVIISATPRGLSGTQAYLESRGWNVKSTDDLKIALHLMMTEQPETVLVCMDHPNKNVNMLPQLIQERVRCCVIATTQKSTVENYHLLRGIQCEYKLFPPSSGPSVERITGKYIRKLNSMAGVPSTREPKRSGISPRMFRLNLDHEKPGSVIDYANLDFKQKIADKPLLNPSESSINVRSPITPTTTGNRLPDDHLLVRGTERLISEIIDPEGTPETALSIHITTQITCMLIECESFQGYLVAALGKDCHLDDNFTGIVHRHLSKFLEEKGQTLGPSEVYHMSIKPVAFLDWAEEYAGFLRKSVHKENEVAFAFFPLEGVRATYQPSSAEDMLSVPLTELFGEAKVEFNLYIFFPANKKYVLYTPAGSVFYNLQKDRLAQRGIGHLHIKREDLKELNRYRAQKYFNTIVEEYTAVSSMPA
jgi:hypothetical protein